MCWWEDCPHAMIGGCKTYPPYHHHPSRHCHRHYPPRCRRHSRRCHRSRYRHGRHRCAAHHILTHPPWRRWRCLRPPPRKDGASLLGLCLRQPPLPQSC